MRDAADDEVQPAVYIRIHEEPSAARVDRPGTSFKTRRDATVEHALAILFTENGEIRIAVFIRVGECDGWSIDMTLGRGAIDVFCCESDTQANLFEPRLVSRLRAAEYTGLCQEEACRVAIFRIRGLSIFCRQTASACEQQAS